MTETERKDFIFRTVNTPHQFSYENGVTVTRVEPGRAEGILEVGPNSINPHGNVHGGALATLADTVGGCCACSKGGICVTASSTLSVVQVELFNDNQTLVATGTFTFFMVEPPQK